MLAVEVELHDMIADIIVRITLPAFALKAFSKTFVAARSRSIAFKRALIVVMTCNVLFSLFIVMAFQFALVLAFKSFPAGLFTSTVGALFKVAGLSNSEFDVMLAR